LFLNWLKLCLFESYNFSSFFIIVPSFRICNFHSIKPNQQEETHYVKFWHENKNKPSLKAWNVWKTWWENENVLLFEFYELVCIWWLTRGDPLCPKQDQMIWWLQLVCIWIVVRPMPTTYSLKFTIWFF